MGEWQSTGISWYGDSSDLDAYLAVLGIERERFMTDPGFGFSLRGPIPPKDGVGRDDGGRIFGIRHGSDHRMDLWSLHRDGRMENATDALKVQPADVLWGHLITDSSRTTRRGRLATVHETITNVEAVEGVQRLGASLGGDEPARLLRVPRGWS